MNSVLIYFILIYITLYSINFYTVIFYFIGLFYPTISWSWGINKNTFEVYKNKRNFPELSLKQINENWGTFSHFFIYVTTLFYSNWLGLETVRSDISCFNLASILIKPVQRILKYPLILSQLLKYTEQDNPDVKDLQHAIGNNVQTV